MIASRMTAGRSIRSAALLAVLAAMTQIVQAAAPTGRVILHSTPPYASASTAVRPENPATVIDVTIWLKPHDRATMDALAQELYDTRSPNYRHWLTRQEVAERFAPSANEAATVRQFFSSHNLHVVLTDRDNFFVRARGTVGDVQKAFQVPQRLPLARQAGASERP